jgi:NAD dependent epimerase/dehydratase family
VSPAYCLQYGFNAISLMPTNLYGPGDNFNLQSSHVLPALIRKFHDAKQSGAPEVVVWGTGSPRREFLHVDDLADRVSCSTSPACAPRAGCPASRCPKAWPRPIANTSSSANVTRSSLHSGPDPMSRQLLVRIAPFWILLIVVGSFLPGAVKHAIGTSGRTLGHQCSPRLIRVRRADPGPDRRFPAQTLGGAPRRRGLAFLVESLQHSLYPIPMEWWDVRDDTLAAAAAWLLATFSPVRTTLLRSP